MADISVVIDKLHGFETADDIAEFFREYGIIARPSCASECAISRFVKEETGISPQNVTTTQESVTVFVRDETIEATVNLRKFIKNGFPNTAAMTDFVQKYDEGYYSFLVEKGYEVE